MQRFVQTVVDAYRRIGFIPFRAWLSSDTRGRCYCCGLSALVLDRDPALYAAVVKHDRGGMVLAYNQAVVEAVKRLFSNRDAIAGFMTGFDDADKCQDTAADSRGYDVWYRIGKECWKAVEPLVPAK